MELGLIEQLDTQSAGQDPRCKCYRISGLGEGILGLRSLVKRQRHRRLLQLPLRLLR
jgi:hypothetical protein